MTTLPVRTSDAQAYCGNVAATPEDETAAAFDALFAHARTHDVQVDLHIDETNDAACCAIRPLITALRRAREAGYRQRVVLGHATALSLQRGSERERLLAGLASLAPIAVICNPSTNLGLQDRRGSAPPHCSPIDVAAPRTPQWLRSDCSAVYARTVLCGGRDTDS